MAQFRFQPVDAAVLVWRQGGGDAAPTTGTARPERRFDVLVDGVFVWGRRRPAASATSTDLIIADASHSHASEALALSVQSVLALADAVHAHTAEGLVLTAASVLAIQDALHAHAADNITLLPGDTLLIADALHAHTSDGVALTVSAWLVVADAMHGHAAANVVLTFGGTTIDPNTVLRFVRSPPLPRVVRSVAAARSTNGL